MVGQSPDFLGFGKAGAGGQNRHILPLVCSVALSVRIRPRRLRIRRGVPARSSSRSTRRSKSPSPRTALESRLTRQAMEGTLTPGSAFSAPSRLLPFALAGILLLGCDTGSISAPSGHGSTVEFSAGITGQNVGDITAGPDGNVWFTEQGTVLPSVARHPKAVSSPRRSRVLPSPRPPAVVRVRSFTGCRRRRPHHRTPAGFSLPVRASSRTP